MYRRRLLAGGVAAVSSLAGCAESDTQPSSVVLLPVVYNRTPNIETVDIEIFGEGELLFETTYTVEMSSSIVAEQPVTLLTDTQYSVTIDRYRGETGVYTVVPEETTEALAIHVREDGVVVYPESHLP